MERRPADEESPLVVAAAAAGSMPEPHTEAAGLVLMAGSAAAFSAVSVFTKALAQGGIPPLEIVLARSVVQLGLGLCGCAWAGQRAAGPRRLRGWLLLRGAGGAAGNALFFYAISVLPLADATVVFFTGPVFSALFASWMLGEPYTAVDRAASALCLLGIVLVVKPGALFDAAHDGLGPPADNGSSGRPLAGAAAALLGAMSGAFAYCVVRRVGAGVHFMVHVVYFGALSLLGSSLGVALDARARLPRSPAEWALMGGLGLCAFAGQALLNRGLQLAPAGPATLVRSLDVPFAFLLGAVLFAETPDAVSLLGAAIIVVSSVGMGVYRHHRSAARNNSNG